MKTAGICTIVVAGLLGGPPPSDAVVGLSGEPRTRAAESVGRTVLEFRPVLETGAGVLAAEPSVVDEQVRPASPSSPSDAAYYITAAVQKEFDELDCSQRENLVGGRVGRPDEAFVTCDRPSKDAKDSDLATLAATGEISKYILGPVEVDGSRIDHATAGIETLAGGDQGTRWVVNVEFDSTGTRQFAAVSERLLPLLPPQNRFGIVLDGLVVSAPSINAVILDGKAEISGSFTRDDAKALASYLDPQEEKSTPTRLWIMLGSLGAFVVVLVVALVALVLVLRRKPLSPTQPYPGTPDPAT
ncbi:MAG: hypothetical protein FWF02_01830 [Micrococcales bacterium]|nr:hypothetical protein [Micrococcales bacterium]MCL2666430.1 hypothetical protein [Micrococcales bacterium]